MSVTKADLIAAREGIHKTAAPGQPGIMDRLFYGKGGGQQLQDMTTVDYWTQDMNNYFKGRQPTVEEKKKYFEERSKKFIGSEIQRLRKSGLATKEEAVTGGIGLGLGALVGAAFGGAKGAVIGSLLGGVALWAMEKFDLTPDFAKGFVGDAAKALPGMNPDEPAMQEALKAATHTISTGKPPQTVAEMVKQDSQKYSSPVEEPAEADGTQFEEKTYSTEADRQKAIEAPTETVKQEMGDIPRNADGSPAPEKTAQPVTTEKGRGDAWIERKRAEMARKRKQNREMVRKGLEAGTMTQTTETLPDGTVRTVTQGKSAPNKGAAEVAKTMAQPLAGTGAGANAGSAAPVWMGAVGTEGFGKAFNSFRRSMDKAFSDYNASVDPKDRINIPATTTGAQQKAPAKPVKPIPSGTVTKKEDL